MDPEPRQPLDASAIHGVLAAVRQAADVICDRWTLLVLVHLAAGAGRFSDLQERTGASTRVLAGRLLALERQGVLSRRPYSSRPDRFEHRLESAGRALVPVLAALGSWDRRAGVSPSATVPVLHHSCGAVDPATIAICGTCARVVNPRDIDVRVDVRRLDPLADKALAFRRTSPATDAGPTPMGSWSSAIAIFGDKWTTEVVMAAFLRVRSFGEFERHLGISSNVLSDRLSSLVHAGVLDRVGPAEVAPRGGYLLSELGRGLFPTLLALEQWADTWLRDRRRSPLALVHRQCGVEVRMVLRCAACAAAVTADSSSIRVPL